MILEICNTKTKSTTDRISSIIRAPVASLENCERRQTLFGGNRNWFEALELIEQYNGKPEFDHEIDARIDLKMVSSPEKPTYRGEKDLRQMLKDAGFPVFDHEKEIEIGEPFKRTRPDLYFEDPSGSPRVAIYLDGLSKSIHGDPETHRKDKMIRMQLESQGIDVIEIARSDLDDPEAMRLHYKRIAYKIGDKERADSFD